MAPDPYNPADRPRDGNVRPGEGGVSAAALYLYLRALGMCLEVVDQPERGDSCKIKTWA